MTVSTKISDVTQDGNGSNRSWTWNFLIPDEESLQMIVTDEDGIETTITTNFTVTGIGLETGGTITYPTTESGLDPLSSTDKFTINRVVPNTQPRKIRNQRRYDPQVVEDALDRLTMQVQQNTNGLARAVKVPISSSELAENYIATITALKNEASAAAVAAAADAVETAADRVQTGLDVVSAGSHKDKAQQWAEEDEDVEVETGQYSAKHWAAKAEESAGGGISNVVEDLTPQLGGNLDVNGQSIVSASNGDIVIEPNGTGDILLNGIIYPKTDGTASQILKTDGAGNLAFADAGGGGEWEDVLVIDALADSEVTFDFDDPDTDYRISLYGCSPSTTAELRVAISSNGGTNYIANLYDYGYIVKRADASSIAVLGDTGHSNGVFFADQATGVDNEAHGSIEIIDPQTTGYTTLISDLNYGKGSSGGSRYRNIGSIENRNSLSINNMKLYYSSGTITGKFKLQKRAR